MKLKLDGEMKEIARDMVATAVWVAVIYALLAMTTFTVALVTALDPSPATTEFYGMLANVFTTAIGVALGIGLGQPFLRRRRGVEKEKEPPE
jgi:hypothetical protein